jgi:hypothetical protein
MRRTAGIITLGAALVLPTMASATPGGVYDAARPGTGCNCHQFGPPTSPTRVMMFVDDDEDPTTPADSAEGFRYVPGTVYRLMVWVLGPTPGIVGFNLLGTAGTLVPVDGTTQAIEDTECTIMQRNFGCIPGSAANDCRVLVNGECGVVDGAEDAACRCPSNPLPGTTCRPCDAQTARFFQATHTAKKTEPFFDLTWTAPSVPVDVEFFIAGNDVSGEGNAGFDFWNFVEPNPIVLRPVAP